MKSINFLPENYDATIDNFRKQGTIRLGDNTQKYYEDEIVWITVGNPLSGKRRVFTALIDRVLVKKLSTLSQQDLQNENAAITNIQTMQQLLSTTYKTPVNLDDVVTVIRFSEVME